jgi:hypothetical protein
MRPVPHLREVLSGLHPVSPHPCTRCGTPTAALANGRGRVDICASCGTFDLVDHDGTEILSMRQAMSDLSLPITRRAKL